MSDQIDLSLCIITQNDAQTIGGCIRQFEAIAGEVIVADLGSVDHTPDIARREGASVYEAQWQNDFSEIRNFCMEHAKGRWVLFLQSNETIIPEHIAQIPVLLKNPNAEAYIIFVDYASEEFRISSPVQSLRLLRNRKEYRYIYRSFEMVPDEVLTGIVDSRIQIRQQYDTMQSWQMVSRIVTLQQEMGQNPQDPYLQYMAGILLLNQQELEESADMLQNARSVVNYGQLFVPHLFKCLCCAYIYMERYPEAMEVINEGIEQFPFYSDLLILRAEIYKQLSRPEDAVHDLEFCLHMRDLPNVTPLSPEISNAFVFESLGEIHRQALNNQQALACCLNAYELDCTDIDIMTEAISLIETTASVDAADAMISIALKQEEPLLLIPLLNLLLMHHAHKAVLMRQYDIAQVLGEEQASLIAQRCSLMTPDAADADAAYINHPDIFMRRIENCWVQNNWEKANKLMDEAEKIPDIGSALPLYRYMQNILTQRVATVRHLSAEEVDIVVQIHSDLLWKGCLPYASVLLSLLAGQLSDTQWIDIAVKWAAQGDCTAVVNICSYIKDADNKKQLVMQCAAAFLRHGDAKSAEQLRTLYGIILPEPLKSLLGSQERAIKICEWAKSIADAEIADLSDESLSCPAVDKHLCKLCGNLCGTEYSELKEADAYEKIGDAYLKAQKVPEAFFAYTRAIATAPINFALQQKLIGILQASPELRFLWEKSWVHCVWFDDAKEWHAFIEGIAHFVAAQFSQAKECFSHLNANKITKCLRSAYIDACLWLDNREDEILACTALSSRLTREICLDYFLFGIQKDPLEGMELIKMQKDRLRQMKQMNL